MMSLSSMRGVTLATLLVFGSSGCIVVHNDSAPDAVGNTPARRPGRRSPHGPNPPGSSPSPSPSPSPSRRRSPSQSPNRSPSPSPNRSPSPGPSPSPSPSPGRSPGPSPRCRRRRTWSCPCASRSRSRSRNIDALIVKTAKQDWRTVSAPNAPTKVELKYTVWRDPIKASFADGTLKVGVSVRYAANVRVSAKNPLGELFLAHQGRVVGHQSPSRRRSARGSTPSSAFRTTSASRPGPSSTTSITARRRAVTCA